MSSELRTFIPAELADEPLKLNETLLPVVARIGVYLTPQEIWQYYSSSPTETGGIRNFPYCRVDGGLCICQDSLFLTKWGKESGYEQASKQASNDSGFMGGSGL